MAAALAGDELVRSLSSGRRSHGSVSNRSWASASFREVWSWQGDVFDQHSALHNLNSSPDKSALIIGQASGWRPTRPEQSAAHSCCCLWQLKQANTQMETESPNWNL